MQISTATITRKFCALDDCQKMLLWIFVLLCYRLLIIGTDHLAVFFDEAYYYYWAQAPDWGYYSKPPVVAWFIAVSSSVFGATDLGVKFFSPLLYSACALCIFHLARELFNARVALLSGVIFTTTPIVGFNSLFITTDAPLFFFWALTTLLFVKALNSSSWLLWLALGISTGLGMLSKYTFVMLPFGLFVYLFFVGKQQVLLSMRCLVAIAACLALFATNIWWNMQNDFISFSHTQEIAKLDRKLFNFDHLFEFLLSQCLIFGAVWSVYLITKSRHLTKTLWQDERFVLLVWITLPILGIIASQAFLSRAFVNWAGPFVIGASVTAAVVLVNVKRSVVLLGVVSNLVLLSLFYHWPQILSALDVEQSRKNSPYYRIAGWREASLQVQPLLDQYSDSIVASNSRELLSYVSFYNDLSPAKIAFLDSDEEYIANHFDLVANLTMMSGKSGYIVLSKTPLSQNEKGFFTEIRLLQHLNVEYNQHISRNIYVYGAKGFNGYE